MRKLAAFHRWLKTHRAYWLAPLIAFPELWAHSSDLQAQMPPELVSHLAAVAFTIRLATMIYASAKAKAKASDDDTDQAGA